MPPVKLPDCDNVSEPPKFDFEPEMIKVSGFRAAGKPEPSFLAILVVVVGVATLVTMIVLLVLGERHG
jgi:hypothetical protein